MKKLLTIMLLLFSMWAKAQPPLPTTSPYANAPNVATSLVKYEFYIDSVRSTNAQILSFAATNNNIITNHPINLGTTGSGVHQLYVKVFDANGVSSIINLGNFAILQDYMYANTPIAAASLAKYQFFIDSVKTTNAQTLNIAATSNNVTTNTPINLGATASGVHQLYAKAIDANGVASIINLGNFAIIQDYPYPNEPTIAPNILQYKFYIDSVKTTNAQTLNIAAASNNVTTNTPINLGATGTGVHQLYAKAFDAVGVSSIVNLGNFAILQNYPYPNSPATLPNIVQLEYSIDANVAHGAGVQVPITGANDIANINFTTSTVGLAIGNHYISTRTKNANGNWSITNTKPFIVPNLSANPTELLFGNVATTLTNTLNVQIVNNGVIGQSISGVSLAAPFSTTYTNGAIPNTGSVTIPVTFSPTAILSYVDTLFVTTTSGIIKVVLKGNGVAPVATWAIAPQNYNYGNVQVGQTGNYNFTINNTGTLPLTISNLLSTNMLFTVTPSSNTIPVGGSVSANAVFAPNIIGPQIAKLKFVNAQNNLDTLIANVEGVGYVYSNPPIISFPTAVPYSSTAGVNPTVGNVGIYTYSILYKSDQNIAPLIGFPKVGIDANADGDFIDAGEGIYTMTKIGSTTNWSSGERFDYSTNLPLGSNYRYKFFATDSLYNLSNSAPTSTNVGPLVTTESLDLRIFANDISFSDNNPDAGQDFNVTAVIHNSSPYAASNVPIRFYKDSVYLSNGIIPYVAPYGSASISKTFNFPIDGFYPIKVWIDSSNTLGEVQLLNNYAIRPVTVGLFSVPGEILVTANPPYQISCSNTMVFTGTALYQGLNLVGTPPVLGATVTITIPGSGTFSGYTTSGGNYSITVNGLTCAQSYNYTVTVTDFTLTKTINGNSFTVGCIPASCYGGGSGGGFGGYSGTVGSSCISNNVSFNYTFTVTNYGTDKMYRDTLKVYADNILIQTYKIDSLSAGASLSFTTSFNFPAGNHIIKHTNKYATTWLTPTFVTDINEVNIFVNPNQPDLLLTTFGSSFQVSNIVKTFRIWDHNAVCNGLATPHTVRIYDSLVGTSTNWNFLEDVAIGNLNPGQSIEIQRTISSWTPGYHYVKLVTDFGNSNAEINELNNTYIGLVYVPYPELSSNNITVSNPAVAAGGQVNFGATINNTGAISGAFKVQFLVNDVPLGSPINIASLGDNASTTIVSPIYTVAADSCPVVVKIITDVDTQVAELNELNNVTLFNLGMDIKHPSPEVCCYNKNFTFDKDVAGNFYSFAYNKGSRHAGAIKVRFMLGTTVIGTDIINGLNAGQVKQTGLINYTFNTAGDYTIKVIYDYPNEVCEIKEDNNEDYVYIHVRHYLPDLRILSQQISPSNLNPDPGQTVTVVATVTNIGLGSAAPSKVRFYYNDGPGYVQLGADVPINTLLPGRDTTVAATISFSPSTVGLKVIKVGADVEGVIIEASEINNEATRSIISGTAPDFARSVLQGITFNPNSFAYGDSVLVRNYIRNYGGASGTAWMVIKQRSTSGIVSILDSVQFTINGVDSALVSKKIKINLLAGQIITEIKNSNPEEYNIWNNFDTLNFTTSYLLTSSITNSGNLNMRSVNPLFPDWVGGNIVLNNNTVLNVTGVFTNLSDSNLVVTKPNARVKITNTNTSNTFPVSTRPFYKNFVTLNNTGVQDNFSVGVEDSLQLVGTTSLLQNAVNKTWQVEEQVTGGSNATITFTWHQTDELPGFNRDACNVIHYHNGAWEILSPGAADNLGGGYFSKTVSNVTSFSPFAIVNVNVTILPVVWLNVNGNLIDNKDALIQWSTAQETNSKYFELEHSTDGISFNAVAKVNAAGNSNTVKDYFITHNNIPIGINYYRIKQIDINGKFTYSSIIKLLRKDGLKKSILAPNPATSNSILVFAKAVKQAVVNIYSSNGSLVQSLKVADGSTQINIDVTKLASGMYSIVLVTNNSKEVLSLIKK